MKRVRLHALCLVRGSKSSTKFPQASGEINIIKVLYLEDLQWHLSLISNIFQDEGINETSARVMFEWHITCDVESFSRPANASPQVNCKLSRILPSPSPRFKVEREEVHSVRDFQKCISNGRWSVGQSVGSEGTVSVGHLHSGARLQRLLRWGGGEEVKYNSERL